MDYELICPKCGADLKDGICPTHGFVGHNKSPE